MASDLIPFTIAAPGFAGLNLQDSPVQLAPEYALRADNCVIDKFGRIGARKGWSKISDTDAGIGTDAVTLIHEIVMSDGSTYTFFIANGHIWELAAYPATTVTDVYTGTWDNAGQYVGDSHWKAVSFNDYVWLFKRGQDPLMITPGSPSTCQKISASVGYAGSVQKANEILSAYGRLWTADSDTNKITVYWSDNLLGNAWTGGASGSLNIETVLTNGTRPIVALAAFNGNLIIFCDTSILIYSGADADPSTNLALVEVIDGVGCISRDSIQDIGNDILFLSATGVRSLGRVISEKSAPLNDISRNVRDELLETVLDNADDEEIKSAFFQVDGFYVLTFVSAQTTYYFDLKNRLEDGVCRATVWTLYPYCYFVDSRKRLLMGFDGYVGNYTGYYDSDDTSYLFYYISSHLTGEPQNSPAETSTTPFLKLLKEWRSVVLSSGAYVVSFLWGTDYGGLTKSITKTLTAVNADSAEYNLAEYNVDEFAAGSVPRVAIVRFPISGSGQVYQVGISVSIAGDPFSVQQLGTYYKRGRMA